MKKPNDETMGKIEEIEEEEKMKIDAGVITNWWALNGLWV